MNNRQLLIWTVALLPAAYLATIYSSLPELVPVHFNLRGEADSWAPRGWLWLLALGGPLLMAAIVRWGFRRALAVMPPGKRFWLSLVSVTGMSAVFGFVIHASASGGIHQMSALFLITGAFFAALGNFFPALPQNAVVGFRTPKTLRSERNWRATHRIAGRCWVIAGLLSVVAALVLPGNWPAYTFLSLMLVATVVPLAYSERFSEGEDGLV